MYVCITCLNVKKFYTQNVLVAFVLFSEQYAFLSVNRLTS
jgi:hypothetical protein